MDHWNKDLSPCPPELLSLTRGLSCNNTVVDTWFKLVRETLLKHDLMDKSAQILNCS